LFCGEDFLLALVSVLFERDVVVGYLDQFLSPWNFSSYRVRSSVIRRGADESHIAHYSEEALRGRLPRRSAENALLGDGLVFVERFNVFSLERPGVPRCEGVDEAPSESSGEGEAGTLDDKQEDQQSRDEEEYLIGPELPHPVNYALGSAVQNYLAFGS